MSSSRIFFLLFIFLCLALLETSFFASLPGVLRLLPITFAVGVYLVQSRGWWPGAWLIAAMGAFLDFAGIAPVPLQTIAYGIAALVIFFSARSLFSNRSLFGILACGTLGWIAHGLVQTTVWLIQNLTDPARPTVGAYARVFGWQFLLLMCFFVVLFYTMPQRTRMDIHR